MCVRACVCVCVRGNDAVGGVLMTLGLRQRCGRVWWGMWFRVEKKKEGGGQKKRGRTFSSWPRVVLTFCCGFCEEGDVDTSYEKKPCPKIQYLPDAPEIIKKTQTHSLPTMCVIVCVRTTDILEHSVATVVSRSAAAQFT